MARRPAARPRWAYDGTPGRLVEPPEGKRALGFANGEQPPAPWINYIFHWTGATLDWLSGPDLGTWTRRAQGAVTFTAVSGMGFDTTANSDGSRYVYAVSGTDGTGAVIAVSRRGGGWSLRRNFDSATGTLSGVLFALGKWWCWFDDGAPASLIMTTAPDGGTSSAIESDSNDWLTAYSTSGSVGGVRDMATDGVSTLVAIADSRIVVSVNSGTTWSVNSTAIDYGGGGFGRAVVFDGSAWVALADTGRVWTATDPTSTWTHSATLSAESTWTWRLATDGKGTVIAYRRGYDTTPQSCYVSTDHGATWSTKSLHESMIFIERMYFADDVWIAASTSTPYLWQSNDPTTEGTWTALPLMSDDGNSWALRDVMLAGGAWVAAGFTFTVNSGPARDILAPVYGYDPAPGYLSDAGYLRGRRIDDTAPTDGQVLTWDNAAQRWKPADASVGGSASPTTTQGDLIYRGASADQRLAIGTTGQVLRVSGGVPAWATLAASDVGAVPTGRTLAGLDLTTNRSASDLKTALSIAAADVSGVVAATRTLAGLDLSADRTSSALRSAIKVQDGPRYYPLGGCSTVDATQGTRVIGGGAYDSTESAITGRTQTWTLDLTASVVSGQTATVTLYDITAGSTAATITVSATSPTRSTASVTLPGASHVYELRMSVSGSTTAHYATLLSANIKVTWS